MLLSTQKLGGAATAKILREKALKRYYDNPNHCLHCGNLITVPDNWKIAWVRAKKFCTRSCAATYHNVFDRPDVRNRVGKSKPVPICAKCNIEPVVVRACGARNKWCAGCWDAERARVGRTAKRDTDHAKIRSHARTVLLTERPDRKCDWCGYDRHAECCHLKPVSSFGPDALLSEINAPSNLVWLCPNCHWELDHGITRPKAA